MKIFQNCIVVLEFDTSASFKEKTSWRQKITDNGGTVSYVLTKRASFFVVFNKRSVSCEFKVRQSVRYNIPIVSPKFVEQCLARNRLLDTDVYRLVDLVDNSGFKKGKIQKPSSVKSAKRKHAAVNLASHPSWLYGDADSPQFDDERFELPKWMLLKDKEGTQLQVLEIHVEQSQQSNMKSKYRLYAQSAQLDNNKVTKPEDAIVWYFDTAVEAVSGYEQLTRRYRNPPSAMVISKPGEVDIAGFGSSKLRLVLGRLCLLHDKLSSEVTRLTELLWNEALDKVDTMLDIPMKNIQAKQIEEAEVVLCQLADKMVTLTLAGNDNQMTSLYDQFYEALPHRPEHRSNKWTLREVVAKRDLCQLLKDIVTVSEATDWSTDATTIAKYRALGCHISRVDQSTDNQEYEKLKALAQPEIEIQSVYRVRRTEEEVNFQSAVGNVQMLMHASAPHNFLGILSRGLLLPQTVKDQYGVSRTDPGNLGTGIYFANSAVTSIKYSSISKSTGTRLMLLCNVALGQIHETTTSHTEMTSLPPGCDSIHGVKATDSTPSFFQNDEFAIYNSNQQCVRYLVEFTIPGDKGHGSAEVMPVDLDLGIGEQPMELEEAISKLDIGDVKDRPDPLAKIIAGLQGSGKEHVPLKSVNVRATMRDMVAQVVVLQAYKNENKTAIEAKYVFPLADTAAVCGFEAFINGKHIVGEVKEKVKARREYREAIAKGHGAYLMEEETPDVFTVSVGNLPADSDVLIKVTYIAELQVDGGAICFHIPAAVAPWIKDSAMAQKTQGTVESVKVTDNRKCDLSLQVAVEMPSDIRRIDSPTHTVKVKKTATKAVVELPRRSNLDNGFQLNVTLAEIHVPRMWVERHPESHTQACMLTFYPEFESERDPEPDIVFLLDMSNSMKGGAEEDAKKTCLLAMDLMVPSCRFNVIAFGTSYTELFPSSQRNSKYSLDMARKYIQSCQAKLGSTDVWQPLRCTHILTPPDGAVQNLFLISDGHVTQESLVVKATRLAAQRNRVFTLGVGSSINQHLLRNLASVGGGTYQHYNRDTKSQWQRKMTSQLEKAAQPGLTNVHVDWRQTDDNAPPPVQAPNQIPCLFSGNRHVVYGFVGSCLEATLKAKVNGQEVSTMVSTVELSITTGKMLHQLAARAVITDFENGVLDDDRIHHQVLKTERKQYIVELSKTYSIVTPYTSFVAIEERDKDEVRKKDGPSIKELVEKESVDILPYIGWEGKNDNQMEPGTAVVDLLQRAAITETFSMLQAEECYAGLADYVEYLAENQDLAKQVYERLGTFFSQNSAASIGDIISELEPRIIKDPPAEREITVRTLTGKTVVRWTACPSTLSIHQLMRLVERREGVPLDQMRLIYDGDDGKIRVTHGWGTIDEFSDNKDMTFYMGLALRGGASGPETTQEEIYGKMIQRVKQYGKGDTESTKQKSKTKADVTASREDEYCARRRQEMVSPERFDPFTTTGDRDKSPQLAAPEQRQIMTEFVHCMDIEAPITLRSGGQGIVARDGASGRGGGGRGRGGGVGRSGYSTMDLNMDTAIYDPKARSMLGNKSAYNASFKSAPATGGVRKPTFSRFAKDGSSDEDEIYDDGIVLGEPPLTLQKAVRNMDQNDVEVKKDKKVCTHTRQTARIAIPESLAKDLQADVKVAKKKPRVVCTHTRQTARISVPETSSAEEIDDDETGGLEDVAGSPTENKSGKRPTTAGKQLATKAARKSAPATGLLYQGEEDAGAGSSDEDEEEMKGDIDVEESETLKRETAGKSVGGSALVKKRAVTAARFSRHELTPVFYSAMADIYVSDDTSCSSQGSIEENIVVNTLASYKQTSSLFHVNESSANTSSLPVHKGGRTRETARMSTGGKAPRVEIATIAARAAGQSPMVPLPSMRDLPVDHKPAGKQEGESDHAIELHVDMTMSASRRARSSPKTRQDRRARQIFMQSTEKISPALPVFMSGTEDKEDSDKTNAPSELCDAAVSRGEKGTEIKPLVGTAMGKPEYDDGNGITGLALRPLEFDVSQLNATLLEFSHLPLPSDDDFDDLLSGTSYAFSPPSHPPPTSIPIIPSQPTPTPLPNILSQPTPTPLPNILSQPTHTLLPNIMSQRTPTPLPNSLSQPTATPLPNSLSQPTPTPLPMNLSQPLPFSSSLGLEYEPKQNMICNLIDQPRTTFSHRISNYLSYSPTSQNYSPTSPSYQPTSGKVMESTLEQPLGGQTCIPITISSDNDEETPRQNSPTEKRLLQRETSRAEFSTSKKSRWDEPLTASSYLAEDSVYKTPDRSKEMYTSAHQAPVLRGWQPSKDRSPSCQVMRAEKMSPLYHSRSPPGRRQKSRSRSRSSSSPYRRKRSRSYSRSPYRRRSRSRSPSKCENRSSYVRKRSWSPSFRRTSRSRLGRRWRSGWSSITSRSRSPYRRQRVRLPNDSRSPRRTRMSRSASRSMSPYRRRRSRSCDARRRSYSGSSVTTGSSRSRSRSPKVRSRSPKVRSRSPKVRSRSPIARSRSCDARRRSYSRSTMTTRSSRSRSSSPKVRSRSPKVRSRSPKVRSRSPKVRSSSLKVRSSSSSSESFDPNYYYISSDSSVRDTKKSKRATIEISSTESETDTDTTRSSSGKSKTREASKMEDKKAIQEDKEHEEPEKSSEPDPQKMESTTLVHDKATGRFRRVPAERIPEVEKVTSTKNRPREPSPAKSIHQLKRVFSPMSLEGLDVWSGVRVGPLRETNVTNFEFESHAYSNFGSNCEVCDADTTCSHRDFYGWQLSDARICDLLAVSEQKVRAVLIQQGVKSLGAKMMLNVERIIMTLLVMIYLAKLKYRHHYNSQLTIQPDTKIAITSVLPLVGDPWRQVRIGEDRTIDFRSNFNKVFDWLETQLSELPPLYRDMELGKTRMEFLSNLARIHENV